MKLYGIVQDVDIEDVEDLTDVSLETLVEPVKGSQVDSLADAWMRHHGHRWDVV